jgi:hypothetical protein
MAEVIKSPEKIASMKRFADDSTSLLSGEGGISKLAAFGAVKW